MAGSVLGVEGKTMGRLPNETESASHSTLESSRPQLR